MNNAGSKAAIAGYAKGAARDLGPRNITVNVVQPGEVSETVSFIAGPSAGYITGDVISVSGGAAI